MAIAYWIIAGLLALLYLGVGAMKVLRARQKLAESGMGWVESSGTATVKLVGVLEILGAVGLILPPLLQILPPLAIAAAIGLVLLQIGAISVHVRRREYRNLPVNLVLLLLAAAGAVLASAVI